MGESRHEGVHYSCSQCEYKSKEKARLRKHIKTHDCASVQRRKKAPDDDSVQKRKRRKRNLGNFPCNECEYIAKESKHLKQHVEGVHLKIRYPCDQCDWKGSTKGILKIHVQKRHEGVRYPCGQCEYKATQKNSLKIHIQAMHVCKITSVQNSLKMMAND